MKSAVKLLVILVSMRISEQTEQCKTYDTKIYKEEEFSSWSYYYFTTTCAGKNFHLGQNEQRKKKICECAAHKMNYDGAIKEVKDTTIWFTSTYLWGLFTRQYELPTVICVTEDAKQTFKLFKKKCPTSASKAEDDIDDLFVGRTVSKNGKEVLRLKGILYGVNFKQFDDKEQNSPE